MKVQNKILFMIGLFVLLQGTARADSATGIVNLTVSGTAETAFRDTFFVTLKTGTLGAGNTANCFLGIVTTPLTGDGNKAMYATLLSAVTAGRAINYSYIASATSPTGCVLTQVSTQ